MTWVGVRAGLGEISRSTCAAMTGTAVVYGSLGSGELRLQSARGHPCRYKTDPEAFNIQQHTRTQQFCCVFTMDASCVALLHSSRGGAFSCATAQMHNTIQCEFGRDTRWSPLTSDDVVFARTCVCVIEILDTKTWSHDACCASSALGHRLPDLRPLPMTVRVLCVRIVMKSS